MLQGKVAIVTGAGRGIGRTVAELFASEGATVYVVDIRQEDLKWTESDKFSERLHSICLDITDFDLVSKVLLSIKKQNGHIDILVNNAGVISYELFNFVDYEKLRKMFEVNVIALIYLSQVVARFMMRQGGGSIINMASMVAVNGAKGQLSYSATKGAVVSITKSAAKELASAHIRVNAVAPGMVGTDRFKAVLEEKFRDKINDIPFGRLAEPIDIANTCLYLASDMSQYVTGQIIGVDGGAII